MNTEYQLLIQAVNEGDMNPLEAYTILKAHQIELEKAIKEIQPQAIDEADKWAEKSFKAFGATIEKRNAPAVWKYQGTAYEAAEKRLEYIKELGKIGGGVDPETGEIIEPAVKVEGKATIAVSFLVN